MRFNVNPAETRVFNANALAQPIQQKRAMEADAARQNALAGYGAASPYPQPARAYDAMAQYGGPTKAAAAYDAGAASNDIAAGIIETAAALGVDPVDLATAISYETAGTFDPTKRGPTTQWGQHRGLIQFGEPQAREYGVDWNDPVGSQLGKGGAVYNYLTKNGVRPGMGLLDIYSTINAGAPGLYNRSDANNGGAPGTVRDKVEQQMAGHRRKAEALLASARQKPRDLSQPSNAEDYLSSLGL